MTSPAVAISPAAHPLATPAVLTLEHVMQVLDFPRHAHLHTTTAPLQAVLALDTIFEPESPFAHFVLTGNLHHFTFAVLVNQARGKRTHQCYNTRGGMSRQEVLLDQRKPWTATATHMAFLERATVFELWVHQADPSVEALLATLTPSSNLSASGALHQNQQIKVWLAAHPVRQTLLQEVLVLEQSLRVKRGKASTLLEHRHFVMYGMLVTLPRLGQVVQEARWYDSSYSAQAPQTHGYGRVPCPQLCCAHCEHEPSAAGPLLQCGRCRAARYCNAKCQAAHWSRHKRECVAPQ